MIYVMEGIYRYFPDLRRQQGGTPGVETRFANVAAREEKMVSESLRRNPTRAGREALAARLGLTIDPFSQDWEYEVADPERFPDWLGVYRREALTDDERFSLMEMLVQCVEDLCSDPLSVVGVEAMPEWQAVAALLRERPRLHASTIASWSVLEESDPGSLFRVSTAMRQVWGDVKTSVPDEL